MPWSALSRQVPRCPTFFDRDASPETQDLRFSLPAGVALQMSNSNPGEVDIVSSGGDVLGRVPASYASDAQGQAVPLEMSIDGGDAIRLTVHHLAGSYAYPILVDPLIETWTGGTIGPYWTHYSDNTNISPGLVYGWAYWAGKANTSYPAGAYGEYAATAPAGSYIYKVVADGVAHTPDKSSEFGGILKYDASGWETGTWSNSTGGNGAPAGEGHQYERIQRHGDLLRPGWLWLWAVVRDR